MEVRSSTAETIRESELLGIISERETKIRELYGELSRKDRELSRLRVLEKLVAKALRDGATSLPSVE